MTVRIEERTAAMKESGRKTEIEGPIIKGVPATKIIQMLSEGHDYQQICDRYPALDWPEINEAVHFRNHVLVPARLAEGKTPQEIAKEFDFSPQNVSAIMSRLTRDKELQERWGGLPARVVAIINKTWGCRNLVELREKFPSPTEEDLLMAKGIGKIALDGLRKVLTIKAPDPHPRQKLAPVYITRANHLRGPLWKSSPPRHAWEIAQFFHSLIQSAGDLPLGEEVPSRVPCMAGPQMSRTLSTTGFFGTNCFNYEKLRSPCWWMICVMSRMTALSSRPSG